MENQMEPFSTSVFKVLMFSACESGDWKRVRKLLKDSVYLEGLNEVSDLAFNSLII
jgi:hypothetical protein